MAIRPFVLAWLLVVVPALPLTAAPKPACDKTKCAAGTKVVLEVRRGERFYVCPSKELTAYTNFVLGMLSISKTLTGQMPNISPTTGDPDQGPQMSAMLRAYRQKAGVRTFDEAVARCVIARKARDLTVMNSTDPSYIWVGNAGKTFWTPSFGVRPLN